MHRLRCPPPPPAAAALARPPAALARPAAVRRVHHPLPPPRPPPLVNARLQDYPLQPLVDDCRLMGSLLDDCLRIEVGDELFEKVGGEKKQRGGRGD